MRRIVLSTLTGASVLALVATLVVALTGGPVAAVDCPPGMVRVADAEQPMSDVARQRMAVQYRGGGEIEYGRELRGGCIPRTGPESFTELALRDAQMSSIRLAPTGEVRSGAAESAAAERAALVAANPDVPGTGGAARKYGVGPINSDDDRFPEISDTGFVDNTGRIDDFHWDAATGRLFAAIGTGGVWLSEDRGDSWRPITDNLPSTVVSSVAWTPVGGPDGTVVVTTGEHTFGGFAFTGIGTWHSRDLGATWKRSSGPRSDTLGFATEVDPTDPRIVYSATGNGLWRSTDGGVTFSDVRLPTGDCQARYDDRTCNFANFVTDVVVQVPGGVGDAPGGRVLATVGWRAGQAPDVDGSPQSCCNGVYRSDTGRPGTFERLDGLEAAFNDGGAERIGRVEMGMATGPEQDHDIVYAIVEDAVLFNGGPVVGPLPDPGSVVLGSNPTIFGGVYSSTDFGASWTLLADDVEMSKSCVPNQSAYCVNGLIEPGAQSWYNMWIQPDPTQADPRGVPTRLLLGLEEIWQNRAPGTPTDTGATAFEVIGRYYADGACLVGECTANAGPNLLTTTHPDQHAGLIIPGEDGGAELFVGHDGGLSRQLAGGPEDPFDQNSWDLEQVNGLQTLLPYQAAWANDGTAYMGLQDNGHVKVIPEDDFQQFGTFGADGTYAAVDPENSDYAWESVQGGSMNVTTDGGTTWASAAPPADNKLFVNPAAMDPLDANHLVSGGTQVNETLVGPATADEGWLTVFDLGTSTAPQPEGVEAPPNQITAVDVRGPGTYVGFCGVCDILNSPSPFRNGIATNVGHPDELPEAGTSKGWRFAAAEGLPNRYITSVAIDPQDPTLQTIYVTLGGYSRSWVGPGAVDDDNANVGEGHVFRSTDAGESFVDISGNLPDISANWVEPRGRQLLVGTDHGLYLSSNTRGGNYAVVAPGVLPNAPVLDIDLRADDPDVALIAYYGRGLWTYRLPNADVAARRLAGETRVETAVEVSRAEFDASDTVAISRADLYADALTGAPLARAADAPMLLTPTEGLHPAVAAEIDRLGATRALVFGGPVALSEQVVEDLRAAGIEEVDRIAGETRFGTAREIARRVGGREVYVTEGADPDPARGWPDAMSIAPVAAQQQRPILLVETDRVPDETIAALDDLGANGATVVGGPVAVSDAVEDRIGREVTIRPRIAGETRYATSIEALRAGQRAGLATESLWLARATAFPDALSAGPTVAGVGGSLLLVPEDDLAASPDARQFLASTVCATDELSLLGGPVAISSRVERQVRGLVNGCPDLSVPAPPEPAPVRGPQPPPGEQVVLDPVVGPFGFEDGAQGWTVSTPSPGLPPSLWARTEGNGHGGSDFSFDVRPYGEEVETILTSPSLTVPDGRTVLTWANTLDVEGGDFDEVHVELSEDGGATWRTLKELGGQNVGFPEYSVEAVPFSTDANEVLVRFRLFSDEICSSTGTPVCARPDGYDGVRIDDVAIAVER